MPDNEYMPTLAEDRRKREEMAAAVERLMAIDLCLDAAGAKEGCKCQICELKRENYDLRLKLTVAEPLYSRRQLEEELQVHKIAALFLWELIDNIDTSSDAARGDDFVYRLMVESIQADRFKVGGVDPTGMFVTFRLPDSAEEAFV